MVFPTEEDKKKKRKHMARVRVGGVGYCSLKVITRLHPLSSAGRTGRTAPFNEPGGGLQRFGSICFRGRQARQSDLLNPTPALRSTPGRIFERRKRSGERSERSSDAVN